MKSLRKKTKWQQLAKTLPVALFLMAATSLTPLRPAEAKTQAPMGGNKDGS